VISLIAFGLAVALLVAHLLDGRVSRSYVLAAFIASALIAVGDLREHVGQVCVTAVTVVGDTRMTCEVQYAVKVEALAALIASIGFAMLVLVLEALGRLAATAVGWTT
jgi:hypothetical protein